MMDLEEDRKAKVKLEELYPELSRRIKAEPLADWTQNLGDSGGDNIKVVDARNDGGGYQSGDDLDVGIEVDIGSEPLDGKEQHSELDSSIDMLEQNYTDDGGTIDVEN